jgi:mannitol/fructose-specific phosphotransferase system IIA component (Ntr-type)
VTADCQRARCVGGGLVFLRARRQFRCPGNALAALASTGKFERVRGETQSRNIHIGEYIEATGVVLELRGRRRDDVLLELIDHLPALNDRPAERQRLFEALQEREELCSTSVGDGIAIPHARNALIGLVDRPVIVFGRKADGLPFGSIDGSLVRLFFLVVAPTVTLHLQALARLSRLLRNPQVRQGLLSAETASRVLSLIRVTEIELDAPPSR